jgi:hypothetical protein
MHGTHRRSRVLNGAERERYEYQGYPKVRKGTERYYESYKVLKANSGPLLPRTMSAFALYVTAGGRMRASVCMCVNVRACAPVCVFVCVRARACVCVLVCAYVCTRARALGEAHRRGVRDRAAPLERGGPTFHEHCAAVILRTPPVCRGAAPRRGLSGPPVRASRRSPRRRTRACLGTRTPPLRSRPAHARPSLRSVPSRARHGPHALRPAPHTNHGACACAPACSILRTCGLTLMRKRERNRTR